MTMEIKKIITIFLIAIPLILGVVNYIELKLLEDKVQQNYYANVESLQRVTNIEQFLIKAVTNNKQNETNGGAVQ